jgi:SAM-dependent methyltransferase
VDYEILSQSFEVTGSDSSSAFLERYRAIDPDANLLLLDAVTLDVDRTFDAIYSNKVLQHLTPDELRQSLRSQAAVLKSRGIALHSLWYGARQEELDGLLFVYHTHQTFTAQVGPEFAVVEIGRYSEMDEDDSLYLVLRKKQ